MCPRGVEIIVLDQRRRQEVLAADRKAEGRRVTETLVAAVYRQLWPALCAGCIGIGPRSVDLAAHGGQRVVSLQRQIPGIRERLGLQRQCQQTQQQCPHHEVTPGCSRLRHA